MVTLTGVVVLALTGVEVVAVVAVAMATLVVIAVGQDVVLVGVVETVVDARMTEVEVVGQEMGRVATLGWIVVT